LFWRVSERAFLNFDTNKTKYRVFQNSVSGSIIFVMLSKNFHLLFK
jgi:hypothetical protein